MDDEQKLTFDDYKKLNISTKITEEYKSLNLALGQMILSRKTIGMSAILCYNADRNKCKDMEEYRL